RVVRVQQVVEIDADVRPRVAEAHDLGEPHVDLRAPIVRVDAIDVVRDRNRRVAGCGRSRRKMTERRRDDGVRYLPLCGRPAPGVRHARRWCTELDWWLRPHDGTDEDVDLRHGIGREPAYRRLIRIDATATSRIRARL